MRDPISGCSLTYASAFWASPGLCPCRYLGPSTFAPTLIFCSFRADHSIRGRWKYVAHTMPCSAGGCAGNLWHLGPEGGAVPQCSWGVIWRSTQAPPPRLASPKYSKYFQYFSQRWCANCFKIAFSTMLLSSLALAKQSTASSSGVTAHQVQTPRSLLDRSLCVAHLKGRKGANNGGTKVR